jgi:hypothetical protein
LITSGGNVLPPGDLLDQIGPVAPVQAIESQHRHLRLAGPGWLKLGAERHDQQHRQTADPVDGEVEQLARGRVEPMCVLEDHYQRLLARQALELSDQRLQCPFLLALRTEVRQRVAFRTRQRQQLRQERHILVRRHGAGQ